jgi:hydroxyacylglutathione hydrolase
MTEPVIYFKQMEIGPMANFIYFVGDPKTRECAVVDPAWDVEKILKTAESDGYEIKHIFLTHGHSDHVNGVPGLLKKIDAQLHIHRLELTWMIPEWKAISTPHDDGDIVKVGTIPIRLIHTPGHTPGSQCFLVNEGLVSGDTLFINACGRTDLQGGDPEQLYDSLTNRLAKLSDSTILYPGHNYADQPTATMAEQKKYNPFLRVSSLPDFLRMFRPR